MTWSCWSSFLIHSLLIPCSSLLYWWNQVGWAILKGSIQWLFILCFRMAPVAFLNAEKGEFTLAESWIQSWAHWNRMIWARWCWFDVGYDVDGFLTESMKAWLSLETGVFFVVGVIGYGLLQRTDFWWQYAIKRCWCGFFSMKTEYWILNKVLLPLLRNNSIMGVW